MLLSLCPEPKIQFFDGNGKPLAGGKLYTYKAGTGTPGSEKYTYADSTGSVDARNPFPVILDGAGRASIWLDGTYLLVLKDADDNHIWTQDNVSISGYAASSNIVLIDNSTGDQPDYELTSGNTTVVKSDNSVNHVRITSPTFPFASGADYIDLTVQNEAITFDMKDNTIYQTGAVYSGAMLAPVVPGFQTVSAAGGNMTVDMKDYTDFTLVRTDNTTNTVTIQDTTPRTILGQSTFTLTTQNEGVRFVLLYDDDLTSLDWKRV